MGYKNTSLSLFVSFLPPFRVTVSRMKSHPLSYPLILIDDITPLGLLKAISPLFLAGLCATSDVAGFNYGGERGIRTLGTLLTYTRFPGVLLQPLGHLSGNMEYTATDCGL